MSFNNLLINSESVKTVTVGDWLEPTATAASETCRVMYGNKLITNFKGEEVMSIAKLFIKPASTISHTSRITLDGLEYSVGKIKKVQDSKKIHHIEVWITG